MSSPPFLARKAEGRRQIADRSFAEKIERMEALRERLAPFKRLREQRRAAQAAPAVGASHADPEDRGEASATSRGSNT